MRVCLLLVSDSGTSIEPGDMIVFEETGEVCVLIELFDVAQGIPPRKDGQPRLSKWAWKAIWQSKPDEEIRDLRGPYQRTLQPGSPKDVEIYGISKMNLFNCLSHRRARKEGTVITVPKIK